MKKGEVENGNATAVLWCLIGLASGIVVGMWFPPELYEVPARCEGTAFWCVLFTWQTLLAGSFALVGAFLLWMQIDLQQKAIKREAERRQIQARLQLPHALSEIHTYLNACFQCWVVQDFADKPSQPETPLKLIIAAAAESDAQTFQVLKKYVTRAQPFESRIERENSRNDVFYWSDRLIDILNFWSLNDNLYGYARFEVDAVEPAVFTREEAYRILRVYCGYLDAHNEHEMRQRIEDALDKRFGRLVD